MQCLNCIFHVRFFLLLSSYIWYSCNPSKENTETTDSQTSEICSALGEDSYAELYQYYTANPRSQFEVDQNLIVEYAVKHNLQLSRAENGLFYIIHKQGRGPLLTRGMPVKAHYKGYFLNGKVFDSSFDRGKAIRFTIGQMVSGWDQGMTMVKRGSKFSLFLPSFLGYGTEGFLDMVPPNKVLVFDIEVMEEAY